MQKNHTISPVPPPPADECVGPPNAALTPVVQNVSAMIPTYEFLGIFLEALSNDDEVVQALAYLQGPQFGRIVYDVSHMADWRHVVTYFCEQLGFHLDYYLSIFGELFQVKPRPAPARDALPQTSRSRRPGIVGLWLDLQEIMPLDEMAAYLAAEYERNEFVRRAVEKVRGDEFRAVSEAIQRIPEFDELKEHMRRFGVNVECSMCTLQSTLGWVEVTECAAVC